MFKNLNFMFETFYEGEPEPKAEPKAEPKEAMVPQSKVNSLIAEEKRKMQVRNNDLASQLEAIKNSASTNAQQREELESQITSLRQEFMTKEQIAEEAAKKKANEYSTNLKNVETDRDSWRNRYTSTRIENEITQASVTENAFSPSQLIKILKPDTKLIENLNDDGKPTGTFSVKVNYVEEKDGKTKELLLSVPEAVKKMKDSSNFANLFKGTGTNGLGALNSGSGGSDNPPSDPEAYRQWRKTHKSQIGAN